MRLLVVAMALACLGLPAALAHTTVTVEPYDIEVGWGLEPPVVGVRNTFVFHVTVPGDNPGVKSGVLNAFKNMDATAQYGGITKALEINSDPRPGYYFADVIPTRTGSVSIDLSGMLHEVPVNTLVPIEDIESTALLDFPPREGSSNQDIESLKAAVTSMQAEFAAMQSGQPERTGGMSYDIAVLGVSLGVAAVILAIISLVRRPAV